MSVKIAQEVDGTEVPVAYENTYARVPLAGHGERLVIGLRDRHADMLFRLSALLRPPYKLLCVLHTMRTDAPLGRYESPALDRPVLEQLLDAYGPYFTGDARHDVWLHSRDVVKSRLPDFRPIFEAYASDLKREAERITNEH